MTISPVPYRALSGHGSAEYNAPTRHQRTLTINSTTNGMVGILLEFVEWNPLVSMLSN